MGFDLNRHWQDPSPWAHPTLDATKQYLMQLNANPVSLINFDTIFDNGLVDSKFVSKLVPRTL